MPDESHCPHCKKLLFALFLDCVEKDKKILCPYCKRSILITQKKEIIPLSDCFGDTGVALDMSTLKEVH